MRIEKMQEIILPNQLSKMINGFDWERITIGHSESKTFLLKGNLYNLYLKVQSLTATERMVNERMRLDWLQGKLPVPEVVFYDQDDNQEYLLITEINGVHAADRSLESDLSTVMKQLAYGLRQIHDIDITHCPFDQTLDTKIEEAKRRVENNLVDEEDFDDSRQGLKAEVLFEELLLKKPANENLVFTHGDFSLPNIIINNGKVSGFIDLGRAGVADKYQDLAIAIRSINYNFGKEQFPYFLDAYGVKEIDAAKIHYYQLMDEFF